MERQCHLAEVSRSGFYRQLRVRAPEQEEVLLRERLQQLAVAQERLRGYRPLTAQLRREVRGDHGHISLAGRQCRQAESPLGVRGELARLRQRRQHELRAEPVRSGRALDIVGDAVSEQAQPVVHVAANGNYGIAGVYSASVKADGTLIGSIPLVCTP